MLNAKQHTREAMIVAQAGRLGAVTVATNMAGRGVDILLGGNPEGLARHEVAQGGLTIPTCSSTTSRCRVPLDQMPDEFQEARAEGAGPLRRAAGRVQGAVQGRGRQGPRRSAACT